MKKEKRSREYRVCISLKLRAQFVDNGAEFIDGFSIDEKFIIARNHIAAIYAILKQYAPLLKFAVATGATVKQAGWQSPGKHEFIPPTKRDPRLYEWNGSRWITSDIPF